MLSDSILPLIAKQFPDSQQQIILRLHLLGIGESQAQDIIDNAIPTWPAGVTLGFRAGMPTVEVKLLAATQSQHIAQQYFSQLKQLFADYCVAEGDNTLASALLNLLAAQNKTLACAESCTGGLVSAMLTDIPGASRVFTAGFVTYSNAMKIEMLGVHEKTLAQFGAVSEQTVREMAQGALLRSQADYSIAISGIAGPDGGSEEKPVGTVWIAWGTHHRIRARRFQLGSARKRCQQLAAAIALDLVRRTALGQDDKDPPYFSRW
jgi:nicotinamide-nucleotide amidase